MRVQQGLLAAVEQDLKKAGFPPLAWYDALLEFSRAPDGMLRPVELEKHMLLPQYSTSRLIDRLAEAGLAERKTCPVDGRGQYVVITQAGPQFAEENVGDIFRRHRAACGRQALQQRRGPALRSAGAAGLTVCHRLPFRRAHD